MLSTLHNIDITYIATLYLKEKAYFKKQFLKHWVLTFSFWGQEGTEVDRAY